VIDTTTQARTAQSRVVNAPPPLETATAAQVKQWAKTGTYYGHILRVRDVSRFRRAELYDQGMQWLRESMGGFEQGSTAGQWVEMYWSPNDPSYVPMPVFNKGLGARINESARLGRPNYRPIVTPKSESPDVASREGAKLMKDMLTFRLHECHWDDKHAPTFYYRMPLYGGSWLKSEFVLRWDETIDAPLPSAVSCPECGRILSSREIQPQQLAEASASGAPPMAGNAIQGGGPPQGQGPLSIGWCPWCEGHPQLQPYQVSLEEAATSKDAFQRPLGEKKPKGDWELSCRSDYDVFVRNMGLDQAPGAITEVTEAHVEHLDWIGLRWPDKVGYIQPENPAALAREHPVAGAPDLLTSMLDARLFENCARVIERHRKPWMEARFNEVTGRWTMELNQGRSAIICGDQALFYGPLMMASANYPGQTLERVLYDYVPWEFRDGGRRLQGMGLWDIMFDPQDAANETRSQRQAVRKRMAIPIYLAAATHSFQINAMRGGLPGMIAEIDVDPNAPGFLPQVINNTTIDEGVVAETEDADRSIDQLGGNIDVEQGNPPPGVSAGNAIAFLKGASSEKREPRLARIKAILKRMWQHGARVMCHMYAEPRPLKYKDDDGEERWRYVHGLDFNQQTDVEVDAEPDFDNAAQEIEKVRDSIQMRVIDPASASPSQRRQLARTMKLPEELYEDEDLQEKDAQREWIEYRDNGRMPRIDPGLDDHSTHYQVHGRACKNAYFRRMEVDGLWDDALAILGGSWAMTLQMIALTPNPAMDLQQRIVLTWIQILTQAGFGQQLAANPNAQQAFRFVVVWRAHIEAHRIEDERKQQMAAAGPMLAAPGSPTTAAGNQPTEAAPPALEAAPTGT
jgi:hypothetical protein